MGIKRNAVIRHRPSTRSSAPRRSRSWALVAILPAIFVILATDSIDAQEPIVDVAASDPSSEAPFARLVRIPLPIQGTVDTKVRLVLEQILADLPQSEQRPVVVLEFWPPADGKGDSSEFGRALDLARFLASPTTSGVRTVAYLPRSIRGHAVLVALACEEIVMHPDAKIGAAGINESNIDPTVRRGYSEIADRRRTIPSAVALGLLDPELQVVRVGTATGVRFVVSDDLPEIQRTTTVQSIDTMIPAGEVGVLSGDKLRLDYGFVSHLVRDRRELAMSLNVQASDLEIDPSLGGEWNPVRVALDGPISSASVNRVIRSIEDCLRQDSVNFICIAVDSPGGSLGESIRLAGFLSELDATKVRTVAYIANEARADAAIIALACDQVVMQEEATLGGDGVRRLDPNDIEIASISIREIAQDKNRNWSLFNAFIDDELAVHRYQLVDSNVVAFFGEEEHKTLDDPARWRKGDEVTTEGELLKLTAGEAQDLQLARYVVADFDEFRQKYQLETSPELLEPNWAHELISALASPQVAAGLLFIGFFAMIAELSAPGIGVGGFVSALCFLLFFWSNFLQGTAGWLEVLLFVSGIIFIAMEIFVIPGFGIFGLGGAAMVLASLVLASQTFVIPHNEYELRQLPRSLFTVVGAIAGVLTSLVVLRKYLEKAPMFRRLMLSPPEGAAAVALQQREAVVQYEHLVGKQGRSTTPLSPAGKAEFDGELYDVVSDGLAVDKNALVVVVEVAGNRVVVRES